MPAPVGAPGPALPSRGTALAAQAQQGLLVLPRRPLTTLRLPLSVAATLFPLAVIGNGCGGMEFCEEGSKECASDSGGSAGDAGATASAKGGSAGDDTGEAGSAAARGGNQGSGGEGAGGEGQGGAAST